MMKNQSAKFSIAKSTTYLNCAYMSPILKKVEVAGIKAIATKRNPALISSADFFTNTELLRKEFATLIHAKDSKRIVVIPSVSYGLANVVHNLKVNAAENIIVAAEQFPSNYYPWHRMSQDTGVKIKIIQPPSELVHRGKGWNTRLLEAIDKNTRVVALGNVHWADGTQFDLKAIRKRTREVGALLVIDGTQSVGALPFDVSSLQPDVLVCAGYKWLMGPYSIGLAYYGEYFDQGKPIEESWMNRIQSENFAGLVNYQDGYHEVALRYEVGEHSNFILLPMMLEALKQINQWKPENIQEYCQKITRVPIMKLREAGFWIEEEDFRGHHLFGIRFPKTFNVEQLKVALQKNKIAVSFRGDSVRVAPHVYNQEADLMKLVKVLTA